MHDRVTGLFIRALPGFAGTFGPYQPECRQVVNVWSRRSSTAIDPIKVWRFYEIPRIDDENRLFTLDDHWSRLEPVFYRRGSRGRYRPDRRRGGRRENHNHRS